MNRRDLLKTTGLAGAAVLIPSFASPPDKKDSSFRFCLNTSTLRGQSLGLLKTIDTAAKAGYQGVELWVSDVKEHRNSGNSLSSLKAFITDRGLKVENAIGFAPCFVNDDVQRNAALEQLKNEMEMMAEIGCIRIAAPPAGLKKDDIIDLEILGRRYKAVIDLGRKTGVMPQLEFWGASGTLSQFAQAFMVAASANDPDVKILPDVYHMFRGNSGFEVLKMINGNLIDIFHLNDYPGNIGRENQKDSDRVYPGDGIAPFKQIITDLKNMGGEKVLSLELFNPEYWKQDALTVAETGLKKMKQLIS